MGWSSKFDGLAGVSRSQGQWSVSQNPWSDVQACLFTTLHLGGNHAQIWRDRIENSQSNAIWKKLALLWTTRRRLRYPQCISKMISNTNAKTITSWASMGHGLRLDWAGRVWVLTKAVTRLTMANCEQRLSYTWTFRPVRAINCYRSWSPEYLQVSLWKESKLWASGI